MSFSTTKSCHWRNLTTSNLGFPHLDDILCQGIMSHRLGDLRRPGRQVRGPDGSLQLICLKGSTKSTPFSWGLGGELVVSGIYIWISLLKRVRTNQKRTQTIMIDCSFCLWWYDYDIESRMEMTVLLQMLQLSAWGQKNISLR